MECLNMNFGKPSGESSWELAGIKNGVIQNNYKYTRPISQQNET